MCMGFKNSSVPPTMAHYNFGEGGGWGGYCGILVMLYLASGLPQNIYQSMKKCVVIGIMKIYWSKTSDKIIPKSFYIFLKDHVYGVHQGTDPFKFAISIFRSIFGYINCFQKRIFWWYQASLVSWLLSHMFWKNNWMCSENINERTILDSLKNSWELMSHFLNSFSKPFWCSCSAVWWCSEFNVSHHYDDICQIFTNGFVWWIILHIHRSKLNIIASMVISRYQYHPLTKAIFSSTKLCGNILNIYWGGIKITKTNLSNYWDQWRCIVLL